MAVCYGQAASSSAVSLTPTLRQHLMNHHKSGCSGRPVFVLFVPGDGVRGFALSPSRLPPGLTTNLFRPCRNPPGCVGVSLPPKKPPGFLPGGAERGAAPGMRIGRWQHFTAAPSAARGENSPSPCHCARCERKSAGFNPFVMFSNYAILVVCCLLLL